jgi:hypothetical protein
MLRKFMTYRCCAPDLAVGLHSFWDWQHCAPAGEEVTYRVGLHLIALLTIAAVVDVSTTVSALPASILARLV